MYEFYKVIEGSPLFSGIERASVESMLVCLGAEARTIQKGAPIFIEGDMATHVGLVLRGSVQILQDDINGACSVMSIVAEGDLFAEIFACAGVERYPVSAYAVQNSVVLMLDIKKMLTVCPNACGFHNALVSNLLRIVSRKTMALNRKISFMSKRTTREKLMAFLMEQAKDSGAREFTIPYDRQALADYLGVERSGMSVELNRLKKEGVIDTRGFWFRIND